MTAVITATLVGAEKAIANFEEMKRGLRNRVLRKAVRAGARPGVQAAKTGGSFSDDTGVLRKSATVKVATFSSGITTAIIGPKNIDPPKSAYSRSKHKTVTRNPNNYAHLVELGHRIAVSHSTGKSEFRHILIRRGRAWIATSRAKGPNGSNLNIEAKNAGFVAPRPFMKRSFDASKAQQLSALTAKFAEEVIAEAAKLQANG